MTDSYRAVRRRIANTADLRDIIGAVRALAAVRLRTAMDGLGAVRTYTGIVADGLREALAAFEGPARPEAPMGSHRGLAIGFGSEHGFVGNYNDLVVGAVARRDDEVWLVGARAAAVARETDVPCAAEYSMATRVQSVDDVARALAAGIFAAGDRLGAVDLVYVPYRPGETAATARRLLPLATERFAEPARVERPLHYMAPGDLAGRFAEEYILAELAEVAMESFASENRARLRNMDQTHESIERKLAELRREAHRVRQEEITTELLDIITGAEAQR